MRKTSKVIILHEHSRTGGMAGEIAAIINEDAFDHLDGPIVRIAAQDSPVPFSPPQEEYFLPKVSDVLREARRLKSILNSWTAATWGQPPSAVQPSEARQGQLNAGKSGYHRGLS